MVVRGIHLGAVFSPISTAGRGYITYNPSKKPFEYHTEKDGKQVPLDLEGPSAPHWNDNNEEFWKKADDFCADQPEVPIPYKLMVSNDYRSVICCSVLVLLKPSLQRFGWCRDMCISCTYVRMLHTPNVLLRTVLPPQVAFHSKLKAETIPDDSDLQTKNTGEQGITPVAALPRRVHFHYTRFCTGLRGNRIAGVRLRGS